MEQIIGADTPPAGNLVKDTDMAGFAHDVLEESMQVPVIVDFWAEWCGPCKQLGPILEKVVQNAKGKVKLVKVDIDQPQNQPLAQQLRIQSIPAVYAFRNGQPVDGFVGAQSESQIKAFVERLAGEIGPSPVEQAMEQAEQVLAVGDSAAAAQIFGQILQAEPGNPAATGKLARIFIDSGDLERARQVLATVAPENANNPEVSGAQAALDLAEQSGDTEDLEPLRAAVAANPADHQARFDLAVALNAAGDREGAVDNLIEIITRDRKWNDEAARKQLLQFFEAYGPTDPLTVESRRRLSSLLFS